MPTRKLPDSEWQPKRCRDPEHLPPNMRVFEPGRYEHTCPSCGKKTYFTVPERPKLAAVDRCPRCTSPSPHLHPALQHEGEVVLCRDDFHRRVTPQNSAETIAEHDRELASLDAYMESRA